MDVELLKFVAAQIIQFPLFDFLFFFLFGQKKLYW